MIVRTWTTLGVPRLPSRRASRLPAAPRRHPGRPYSAPMPTDHANERSIDSTRSGDAQPPPHHPDARQPSPVRVLALPHSRQRAVWGHRWRTRRRAPGRPARNTASRSARLHPVRRVVGPAPLARSGRPPGRGRQVQCRGRGGGAPPTGPGGKVAVCSGEVPGVVDQPGRADSGGVAGGAVEWSGSFHAESARVTDHVVRSRTR